MIGKYDAVSGFIYTNESSDHSNSLTFYSVLDPTGLVEDPISGKRLKPGGPGYLMAAIALADDFVSVTTSNSNQISFDTKTINFQRQSSNLSKLDQFTVDLNVSQRRVPGSYCFYQ